MSKLLKVAVAGQGSMGKRRAALIQAHPKLDLVAVEDDDFTDLLNRDLDVMFVSLPNNVAARATIASLERGFHVFCEKPPGRDLDDIAAVMRAEKQHPNAKLMYGFNHRYHGSIRKAQQLVESGVLGNVMSLSGSYTKVGMTGWRTDRKQAGGGILLDQGIHMLDLFLMLCGEFEHVQSRIASHSGVNVEDDAWALLESPSGVVATIHSSAAATQHKFSLEIMLEKGEITLSGILSGTMSYAPERISVRGAMELEESYDNDTSFAQEVASFVNVITQDLPVTVGTSAQAYAAMALVYRIYCADPTWQNKYNLLAEPREQTA